MSRWYLLLLAPLVAATIAPAWAQQSSFNQVKVRFNRSEKDRRLIDKDAVLVLDETARKVIVRNERKPLEVDFGQIEKVVFDVSTHMRGGVMAAMVSETLQAQHVSDYWCYLAYRGTNGKVTPYMIEIDKKHSAQIIEKMKALLGPKVKVAKFPEEAKRIDKKTLKDRQSKFKLKVDKQNHPVPEIKAGKALVVVVCPPLAARFAGQGEQHKLHANDHVVAVNKMGTYSFFYLDPGEYLLVSEVGNASGFKIVLEAGKGYYLLQNTFQHAFMSNWRAGMTSLSRHSKELVMYELSGAYHSVWTRKE